MTCSAGQRSAGSECRDDETAIAEIPCEIEPGIVVASKPEMTVGGFKSREDDHALTRARGVSATAPADRQSVESHRATGVFRIRQQIRT